MVVVDKITLLVFYSIRFQLFSFAKWQINWFPSTEVSSWAESVWNCLFEVKTIDAEFGMKQCKNHSGQRAEMVTWWQATKFDPTPSCPPSYNKIFSWASAAATRVHPGIVLCCELGRAKQNSFGEGSNAVFPSKVNFFRPAQQDLQNSCNDSDKMFSSRHFIPPRV
jgi:hypothetical protein